MPELPEVETVRLGLASHLIGKKIKSAQALHKRATNSKSIAPLSSISGSKIVEVKRRGKFLWLELNRPEVVVAHLGMSGQFLIQPKRVNPEKHLRARFDLGNFELRFVDQRTFGWVAIDQTIDGVPALASHISRDPFDPDFDIDEVATHFKKRKVEIKKALLDQSIMSGVGNIYADEALWLAKINPLRSCEKLDLREIQTVIKAAKKVMARAIKAGGTSFDDLYINVNGESGYFERALAVYGREEEPCRRCGKVIKRIVLANRSAHFCPKCQPIPRGSALEIRER